MTDTSKEAVEALAKDLSALATREAIHMPSGWSDAHTLYSDAADTLRALLAEREALRDHVEALRKSGETLREDMLERARCGMDAIHGDQYRIVNAGNGAWQGFCAVLAATAAKGEGA